MITDHAAVLTAKIYDLLSQPIEPTVRRKMIEEAIRAALTASKQTFESRLAALEELAHEPFDFTDLIRRIEKLESSEDHEARMSEARASIERGARMTDHRFKLDGGKDG